MIADEKTTEQHRAGIRSMAAESFAQHQLTHVGDAGDTKVFRFARPGSSFYAVRVLLWPGWIVVAGDAGDTLFHHSERDSLEWLRRSIDDVRYMLGKVQGARKQFQIGDAMAFVEQLAHDDPDTARQIREAWNPTEHGAFEFYAAVHASDVDDPPDCTDWSSDHLWAVEALRHFLRVLGELAQQPVVGPDHKARHEQLHKGLDELVADWIGHTKHTPSHATVMDLMQWSAGQMDAPTEIPT